MYKVYADDILIHDTTLQDTQLIEPVLSLEENKAGSFEFDIPVTHPAYNNIMPLSTTIRVDQDDIPIWYGRVLEEAGDFQKTKSYYCEGELAYLNDTLQPQAVYHDITVANFLKKLLDVHNQKRPDVYFTLGEVTVTDSNNSIYRYTNRETTLEDINDKLIGRLGGYLRIRHVGDVRFLDYLKDYPNTNSQVISFGENLLDYAKNINMEDTFSVLVPLGARLEEQEIEGLDAYVTIKSVNDGLDYIYNPEAVRRYGWIEKVMTWDDITVPSNLLATANAYMASQTYEDILLEVTAVDLHDLDIDTESIKLLDRIRIISEPHGLDAYFPVTQMKIPLTNPGGKTYTLGLKVTQSIIDAQHISNKEVVAMTEKVSESLLVRINDVDSEKQNVLTPGSGITIINDVIEADLSSKQNLLEAGTNITLTDLQNGHTRIDASGGGGGNYTKTVLFSGGTAQTTSITLSDSFFNYDVIVYKVHRYASGGYGDLYEFRTYYPEYLSVGDSTFFIAYGNNEYDYWKITDDTTLTRTAHGSVNYYLESVIGITY